MNLANRSGALARRRRNLRLNRIVSTVVLIFLIFLGGVRPTNAAINPNLAKNSHAHLANGKSLPHVSGGSEVTFDEERAEAADAQSTVGSDLPPGLTATALGCANRGSETNPRVNQDCTARRQAEEQVAVNPLDPDNIIAGQNDSRVGFNHCGFDYSFDRGATWGDGQPPFFQHMTRSGHTYERRERPASLSRDSGPRG